MELVQKLMKKTSKYLFYSPLTEKVLTECPCKINCNTTKQNDLKWRKTCTGLKFDLEHFNGPKSKFIRDSLYKHPVEDIFSFSITHSLNAKGKSMF